MNNPMNRTTSVLFISNPFLNPLILSRNLYWSSSWASICPITIINAIRIIVESSPINTLTVKKNHTPIINERIDNPRNVPPRFPQADFHVASTAEKLAQSIINHVIQPLSSETTGVALKIKRTADWAM